MRFSYTGLVSLAPDTGEATAIFRPEVQIRLHGPSDSRDVVALVDTGADNTIFPESVARALGIALLPGKGPAAQAFGGQEIVLSCADVDLELVHTDGPLRWQARVYFLAGGANEGTAILGHQGFLDYFSATFIGEECALDLAPTAYLPRM